MRIREHLRALATSSVSAGRAATRPATDANTPHAHPEPELPQPQAAAPASQGPAAQLELGEQLVRSLRNSQQRMRKATEALEVIRVALTHTEAVMTLPRASLTARAREAHLGYVEAALAAVNSRGQDGELLLAGGADGTELFGPDGSYRGEILDGEIVPVAGASAGLALAASALTNRGTLVGSVDVIALLVRVAAATANLDGPRRAALREPLRRAAVQLGHLQSKIDLALDVLYEADLGLELPEADEEQHHEQEASDPTNHLAHTFSSIEAARSLAERTLAIFALRG